MLVSDFWERDAQQWPHKEACIAQDSRWTYAAIDAASNRVAHALLDLGMLKGDRVAVYLENRPEVIISIVGILKAGGAFVVVNPTTKTDKLAYMLNDCQAVALVRGHAPGRGDGLIEEMVPSLRGVVSCDESSTPAQKRNTQYLAFSRELASMPETRPRQHAIDMDLAAIIYTSGSTGRPKGVAVTHLNVISAARSITEYLENRPDDVILNVLPLAFDYGLYQAIMAALMGATLVLERSFAYPYQIVQRVREERVTGFPGVPTVFAVLLQMRGLDPVNFDTVRYVSNTGAALPAPHIERLRRLFRNARIFSMYGVTECKRVTYLPPSELDRRPTSVGRGMPNEEVIVVDEAGRPVPPGVVGELVVRGSNVMQGYWGLPEETAAVLRPGRYPWERVLYTGDLFKTDDEGFLYFVARKDDIIKSRGEKVSPREVENVICELPDVREAAVLGVPDPLLGQAIKAVVVLVRQAQLKESDIIAHCAKRLENFMVPKYVEFRDDLPKTNTGKVRRKDLQSSIKPEQETFAG